MVSEFAYMKELGMEYLVLAPNADSKNHVTYYPTQIPDYRLADGYPDIVDACLRNAEKAGIKVFLGLNFHEDWWTKYANDPDWLYARMQEGNAVADELYRLYYKKYHKAFYGWYWVWEVENLHFKTEAQMVGLAKALNLNVRHLRQLNKELPVMLCPFMNYTCGTPEEYRNMWTYVFAHSDLGKGDIFCPQDCVGAGGLTMNNFVEWFAALRKAVDTKPGLKFWSDTETFVGEDWTSATLDRFVAQLKGVRPYVDQSITFAYSHYYSPNNINPGYYRTYLEYVRTGKLETTPPSTPANLKAEVLPDGDVKLSWDPAKDDIGVCGYNIYRNGSRISRKQLMQKPNDKGDSLTSMIDAGLAPVTKYSYEVQAYDFAGNLSAKTEPLTVTTVASEDLPNNIGKGCAYNVTPGAHENYPDPKGTELTDGLFGDPKNFADPAWQGWFTGTHELVIDLGAIKPVQQFVTSFLNDPGPAIHLPSEVGILTSDDGVKFKEAGNVPIPNLATNEAASYKLGLKLDAPVNARYIKITVDAGGAWVFIDEAEVRN